MTSPSPTNVLVSDLHQTLLALHANPYPSIPNPPSCKKRASVACIVRIRPRYSDIPVPVSAALNTGNAGNAKPETDDPYTAQLAAFFQQEWVQHGDPEILFIKRAARRGDRWTSHVALPGGKRDPQDASDQAAAEREAWEEVGLQLSPSEPDGLEEEEEEEKENRSGATSTTTTTTTTIPNAIYAGPLPQRIVTTDFGAVPLMVLCPFVYLLTNPAHTGISTLKLQPAEVASAHWVPMSALLDPTARTHERADIVDRFASRWGKTVRRTLGWSLGQVLYAAVRLRPSESVFSPEPAMPASAPAPAPAPVPAPSILTSSLTALKEDMHSMLAGLGLVGADPDPARRLLLWGLTHGMISDFLGLFPSQRNLSWWRWPTLSRPDVRVAVWALGYAFRKRKLDALAFGKTAQEDQSVVYGRALGLSSSSSSSSSSPDNSSSSSSRLEGTTKPVVIGEGVGVQGVEELHQHPAAEPSHTRAESNDDDDDDAHILKTIRQRATMYSAAAFMLDGYFEEIQRAVRVTLAVRALLGFAFGLWAWRRFGTGAGAGAGAGFGFWRARL
jgi:8-oxo-dGTP pyrophosphatase MutT (NUDIX family)